jgi:hypothetical protein
MPSSDPMNKTQSKWSRVFWGIALLTVGVSGGFITGAYWRDWPVTRPISRLISSKTVNKPQPKERPTQTGADRLLLPRPLAEHAVLISIDGCRPDLLAVCEVPNLREMMRNGSYTLWARTISPSFTLPSHISMLTGVTPEKHGILWNYAADGVYPNYPTLFELAHHAGKSTAMAVGKDKLGALMKPGTVDWSFIPTNMLLADDATVTAAAVELWKAHRPAFLFVHLPNVDAMGHTDGWGSPSQRAAVAGADVAIGQILQAIRSTNDLPNTLIIITADHGGTGTSHGSDDPTHATIPWIASGPGVYKGADLSRITSLSIRTTDTFATICGVLGIPVPPDNDGKMVRQMLEGGELLQDVP